MSSTFKQIQRIGQVRILSRINENEKWAYLKVYGATDASEEEKLEILRSIKELINEFINGKYDEIEIEFSGYLDANRKEMEYLLNRFYNDLNEPMPSDPFFTELVDVYVYEDYKHIGDKCIAVEKRLELDDEGGHDSYAIIRINGRTEQRNCGI